MLVGKNYKGVFKEYNGDPQGCSGSVSCIVIQKGDVLELSDVVFTNLKPGGHDAGRMCEEAVRESISSAVAPPKK